MKFPQKLADKLNQRIERNALRQLGSDNELIDFASNDYLGFAKSKIIFDEVHDFIVWNGYYFPNSTQQMTMRTHQGLFDGVYKNYDIALKVDKIKFLKPDIALTHVIGAGYTKGEAIPENPTVLMSIIMQKKGDSWKIISFHNLDLLLFDNKETMAHSPMPPQVMYASWYKKQ